MVAIYTRQSVDKKDSLSIEAQIKTCKAYAGKNYKVYTDKGFSGKNTKRPDFQRMFDDIKAGKIEKVIVYKLDRFSRSLLDFYESWEILERHNVEFCSTKENFDTSTPFGKAMMGILMVFAQMERETIAERVRDNYAHRHALGLWLGGPAPYGFEILKTIVEGIKTSILIEDEHSETVKYIFEKFANSNMSLGAMARDLNEKGISGPKREQWDNVSLSRLLKSPTYVKADTSIYFYYLSKGVNIISPEDDFDGEHACMLVGKRDRTKNKYNDIKDQRMSVSQHMGVIDSKIWLKAQEKMENNSQINRGKAGKYTWLTGLIKCASCGYSIKLNNLKSDNKLKMICSGRSNLKICDQLFEQDIREIEELVAAEITEVLKKNPPNNYGDNNKKLLEELVEIETQVERLVDSLMNANKLLKDSINNRADELQRRHYEILEELSKEKPRAKPIDFNSLSFDEKRIVANEFIKRISISDDEINIEWR